MQVKFRIHATAHPNPEELNVPSDWITGILYLEIGDTFFPTEGGGDYALMNLGSWMQNAARLLLPDCEVDNGFMENRHHFVLSRAAGSDDVKVKLLDPRDNLLSEHTISCRRYLASLRGAAKNLLRDLEKCEPNLKKHDFTLRDRLIHIERLEAEIKSRGLP